MPTSSPRINVTVTPEQHSMLLELAELQGRSASSFLREMLDGSMPMLRALLPIYRRAAQAAEIQPQALQAAIRDALAAVEAGREQLDFLGTLTAVEAHSANDRDGATVPAASGASEENDAPARRNRKRA